MSIKTLCRCRGTGKCYIAIRLDGVNCDINLAAFTVDGKPLPSNLIELSEDEYVLVLADLNKKQVFTIADKENHRNILYKETIHPLLFSMASKLNGRLKKDLCNSIRNIDFSGKHCRNEITCDLLSFTPHGQILVGQISGMDQMRCDGIAVLNDKGEIIGKPETTILSPDSRDGSIYDYEVKMYRVEEDHGLVVAGTDGAGEFTGAFCCLKEKPMRNLIKSSTNYFMTAFEDPRYPEWVGLRRLNKAQANAQRSICKSISDGPTFSVIVPLYNTPLPLFDEMFDSVISQTYPFWELVLINSTTENKALTDHVRKRVEEDKRVVLTELDANYGITENTNKGIEKSTGDFICFFDHDDTIEPDLLYEYYKVIAEHPETTMLYCDEDKLLNKELINPSFKPEFSIDLLRSHNYICHMLCVSRKAFDSVEPQDCSLDGAQDHALALKVAELGGRIEHVSKVLYHWRITPNSTSSDSGAKPYASEAGIRAVRQHLKRMGVDASIGLDHCRQFRYRIYYHVPESVKASIVIPVMEADTHLESLAEYLVNLTDYKDFEVLLVSDQTRCESAEDLARSITGVHVKAITVEGLSNPAHCMNVGAKAAKGEVLVFLKCGYAPIGGEWLTELVGTALRNDVGIVGTMSCSKNGLIRQAGLTFTDTNIIELSKYLGLGERGYLFNPLSVRDVSLLGSDCVAISRRVFDQCFGFDESYATYYSVYDLCFKSISNQLWNVYTPQARVAPIAEEKCNSGNEHSPEQINDHERLFSNWRKQIEKGDPFFNANFSTDPHYAESYKLKKHILN